MANPNDTRQRPELGILWWSKDADLDSFPEVKEMTIEEVRKRYPDVQILYAQTEA